MNAVVFCGPSVTSEDARAVLPRATFLGPAAHGDVYRAARRAPAAIALCDGIFEQRPWVGHREILWALSQGIRVYGASSIGALRAAELASFGMIGVGTIYEQYRDGLIHDDDEVAVTHQSEAQGYRPLSEALVNIRATLARATAEASLTRASAEHFIAIARRLYYPERSFEALLRHAQASEIPERDVQRLRQWLHEHPSVNQKRLDAFALLARVRDDLRALAGDRRESPPFEFQNTRGWQAFRAAIDAEAVPLLALETLAVLRGRPEIIAEKTQP